MQVSMCKVHALGEFKKLYFTGFSAQFVGELWFRNISKCMKQRYLQRFETPIAVDFSHAQIDVQVKALDDAT